MKAGSISCGTLPSLDQRSGKEHGHYGSSPGSVAGVSVRDDSVDPATLGDGPFLLVSEGVLDDRDRVVVEVVRGRLGLDRLRERLGAHWPGRHGPGPHGPGPHRPGPHDVALRWYASRTAVFWNAYGRDLWSVVLAPTTPRVAALVEQLAADGVRLGAGVVNVAGWTDDQAERLSSLLGLVRARLAADLGEPPWLLTFTGAGDAEAFLAELEYELGERPLPPDEPSFGPGPWLVISAGHQGDVVEVDVLWGEAHRYSIAGVIRRAWGSGEEILELRGRWWDADDDEDDPHIDIVLGGDPFQVELRRVTPAVAHAIDAFRPLQCCGAGATDIARWADPDARRFVAVLRALPRSVLSVVDTTLFDHPWELGRADRLVAALERLAEPAVRPADPGSEADVVAIWAAVDRLPGRSQIGRLWWTGSCAVVQLVAAEGAEPDYGCVAAGAIQLLWYHDGRQITSPFPIALVDPAEVAGFVAQAVGDGASVDRVELAASKTARARLIVTTRAGRETARSEAGIELPSGRIRTGGH